MSPGYSHTLCHMMMMGSKCAYQKCDHTRKQGKKGVVSGETERKAAMAIESPTV